MSSVPFVGRSRAIEEIDVALAAGRDAAGSLVLITGEAGIGKTRLAREAAARATGYRVVWCAGQPEQGPAFGPWLRLLRAVHGDDTLPGSRARAFDDVVDRLATAAAQTPLLAIFDDLHDADASSLRLLDHVARQLRATRIVVLATCRDGDAVWEGRADIRGSLTGIGRTLTLPPLSVDQVAELISRSGSAVPDDTLRVVARRTGGNALLVTELLTFLRDRGLGDPVTALSVPESVRALVAGRRTRLPADSARAVDAAAVLGRGWDLDALAELLGCDPAEADRRLRPARAQSLIVDTGFGHDLLRDAVYEAIPAADRQVWHAAAARVVTDPVAVARHLLQAGPGAAPQAADAARQAGAAAMSMSAFEDASLWYARAAAALDGARIESAQLGELLVRSGEAHAAAGERDAARVAFRRAADLARRLEVAPLLARAALGLAGPGGFEVPLLDGEQVELLREAATALPAGETALRARTTARLSVALTLLASEEDRRAMSERALDLARETGDDDALAQALAARCDALAGPEDCRRRLDWAGEIVAAGTRLRSPGVELLGRRFRVVALLELGDVAAADAEVLAYAVTAQSAPQPGYGWYVPMWQAMRAIREGRIADSEPHLAQAERLGRRAASRNAEALLTTLRWCRSGELGAADEIQRLLGDVDLLSYGGLWPHVSLALVAAQTGRPDEARIRLDAVAPRLATAPHDSEWLPMMAQVAETIAAIGRHPAAEPVYQAMLPFGELLVVEGIGAALRGPVQRHLGLLAAARGDAGAARRHFDEALARCRRIGATLLVARTLRDAGLALDDPEHLAEAAALYEALGVTARVAEMPRRPLPASPDNVFAPDGDVWLLRYAGQEARLRDAKGLRDLAVLLASPGREHAAVDLAAARAADPYRHGPGTDDLHEAGDLGEVIDAAARTAYRNRLIELDEDAAEADAFGDLGRSEAIARERDALVAQLSAAYGLGGRVRRAGSPAERARTTVTARIRYALRRIEDVHPRLAAHLGRSVRTGTFCVYQPEQPVAWKL